MNSQKNMELTLLSQKVDFCCHFDTILVWSFHHLYLPLKDTELAVRENKTKPTLGWLSSAPVVQSASYSRGIYSPATLPSPAPQANPRPWRETEDCWGRARWILFHVQRNPTLVGRGLGRYRRPAGTLGLVGPPRECRGSWRAAWERRSTRSGVGWRRRRQHGWEAPGQQRKSTRPALRLWNRCPEPLLGDGDAACVITRALALTPSRVPES